MLYFLSKGRLSLFGESNNSFKTAWLTMRLTAIILVAISLHVSAKTTAQDRVTIKEKEISVQSLFQLIKKQTGFVFFYDYSIITNLNVYDVNASNQDVDSFLSTIFKNLPLYYKIVDKTINVYQLNHEVLPNNVHDTSIKSNDISGQVIDSAGNGIIGASILLKGFKTSTITDRNGDFSLKGIRANAVLIISYVGFETKEYRIKDNNKISIELKVKTNELKNIEVLYSNGYQNIPRERSTGSFDQIDNQLINRSISTNILDRLNGVASGVNFISTPATNRSNISIRGISTINANSRPLIVVDGFPYDEPFLGDPSGLTINNLNLININPNDVLNITILKDAAASSIWGARSGNGVIVITTKHGKFNQRPNIQLNTSVTVGGKPNLNYYNPISSKDIIDLEQNLFSAGFYDNALADTYSFPSVSKGIEILNAERAGTISSADAQAQLNSLKANNVNTDINKYLLQNSVNQQYALNLTGGSANYSYFASVGLDKNQGNLVRNADSRLTIRYQNIFRPIHNLEITSDLSYSENKSDLNGLDYSSLISNGTTGGAPYNSLKDSKGNNISIPYKYRSAFVDTAQFPGLVDWHYVPLDELKNNDNSLIRYSTKINIGAKYEIITGLTVEAKYQYENYVTNGQSYYNPNTFLVRDLVNQFMDINGNDGISIFYPIPNSGILDRTNNQNITWNARGQVNYNKIWNQSNISFLAGIEGRQGSSNGNRSRFYGYDPNTANTYNQINYDSLFITRPGGNAQRIPNNSFIVPYTINRYISYFSNAGYTIYDKYTLTASARFDGTNFFGVQANKKIVPLWSSGVAWSIDKEKFYNIEWLPYLRVRATYGFNGNTYTNAAAYPTIAYQDQSPYDLIPAQYATIQSPGNPLLTWEKIKMMNVGFDFRLKNDLVDGTLEYYTKNGDHLIGPIPIDATTGVQSFIGNRASIKGHGIDLTINTNNIKGKFQWQTNFLLSYNIDKVTDYDNSNIAASDILAGRTPVIGKPLYSLFSYRSAGLDPVSGDPRAYLSDTISNYNDVSSNVAPSDLLYNGPANPSYFGSIRNTFSYKRISLSFNIIYKLKYYFRRTSINYSNLFTLSEGNNDYTKRWMQKGDELKTIVPSLPGIQSAARDDVYNNSNVLVDKGDNIKLQDVRISYDILHSNFRMSPFEDVQVFIYANNLGILWRANHDHLDPDFGSTILPTPKSISLGCNIKF